jgi:hypothetical protein
MYGLGNSNEVRYALRGWMIMCVGGIEDGGRRARRMLI